MTTKKNLSESDGSEIKEYHTSFNGVFFKIKKLLYSCRSQYQKIEIIDNEHFGRILLLDGLVQTSERDEFFYHEMLVHPAFMTHPSPQRILIIGGGDGGSLKEVLRYTIERVWLVEIDSEVVEASKKFFPWLLNSLKDERVRLEIADGDELIQQIDMKFNVIVVDSSDPVGPSRSLHETTFFERIKRCLTPGGIVVTQMGSPFYHLNRIKEKEVSLQKLFKIVRFYLGPVPTYPGGLWCFVFLSDDVNPFSLKRKPPPGLKYFNQDIHRSAFYLPNFMREQLD
ncbi:MAG: polyamine aminopropyltransferase [Candidatus Aminicenantaceae bacterium]